LRSDYSGIVYDLPDNGARCYLFRDIDFSKIQEGNYTEGKLTLEDGTVREADDSLIYESTSNFIFKGLEIGSTVTIVAHSKYYPEHLPVVFDHLHHTFTLETANPLLLF
jgi:hypothetical protein